MSARVCQLCGKPLSRIRVGADGDFCSREHRNQHRLRAGMDRLMEANRMASLMRRREQPKSISPAPLEGHTPPRASAAPMIHPGFPAPVPPVIHWKPVVQGPGGRDVMRPLAVHTGSSPRRREFGALRQPRSPLLRAVRRRQRIVLCPTAARVGSAVPRGCNIEPQIGRRLRVSAGIGFRLAAPAPRGFAPASWRPAAMVWRERACPELPPIALQSHHRSVPLRMRVSVEPAVPVIGASGSAVQFTFPGPLAMAASARGMEMPQVRTSTIQWTPQDPTIALPLQSAAQTTPFGAMELADIELEPQTLPSGPRVTVTPFAPQETPFELHATVRTEESIPAPVRPAQLEVHFGPDWDEDWIGGVEDWPLDAAGIRTGALAFFAPTLEMADYELEFLTRIDHHGVSWVFRAASFRDYYVATIAATPSGWQLSLATVLDSEPNPLETVPINMARESKAAFNVRLRAAGDDFTVWVDGKPVHHWKDNLLRKGGIGFVGAPDDRARIYWIRVSPHGDPGKEHF